MQDAYRQEIGAEEDVHRTLPFFATALGALVALLNYSAAQLPSWARVQRSCDAAHPSLAIWSFLECKLPVLLAALSLILVVGLSCAVLWFLGRATVRRDYHRVGPESEIVARSRALHAYHAGAGVAREHLDAIVVSDLRAQLLEPLVTAVEANRKVTRRATATAPWRCGACC